VISTKYLYRAEVVQMLVLIAHYALWGVTIQNLSVWEFLNLYGGGQGSSIFTTGIIAANLH
jgi:hypothetical protein